MDTNEVSDDSKMVGYILSYQRFDEYYEFYYNTGETSRLYILNSHVVRFYMSPTRQYREYPVPIHPDDTAKIIVKTMSDYGLAAFKKSTLNDEDGQTYKIDTDKIQIVFDITSSNMSIIDKRTNKTVLSEAQSLGYPDHKSIQTLSQDKDEYFFGGGMQNGRFTHKGEIIKIANTNKWVDGGVTSPCPFFWSTNGYGVLRNTWQPGVYDFGHKAKDMIKLTHDGIEFDAFYFINSQPKDILCDYYELTGRPIFMPEYAFYEAHLNAFNRDYWVEVNSDSPHAVLFEDGRYYRCYQPDQMKDKTGILESLNGEKYNYQFSARGMIDRYKRHDMPLGWFVPNDGYGCGYGQTDSLDGDIENLKSFADYARSQGVETALWTESNLHPADPDHPKKGERDLVKEVGVAGIAALKCDVAWIGEGYSFGLSAIEKATKVFVTKSKHNTRPMILMVDGWAGTQRYSGIWSGDQEGGDFEYIRFHIPTYIGAGLSGLPVIGSDMDGIYAGGVKEINIRDYQWKTFTPLQLNMDGWGQTIKTPFAYDDDATDINRAYLKFKSMLMPYNYTIGHESTKGLPMVRAMFLEFPNETLAYTKASQYQFMWGPNILVAPIYNGNCHKGYPLRDEIYLPKGEIWVDLFTGRKFMGGKILNNFDCPLWKLPIFVKNGAIIPMVNPNNNPKEIERNNRIFTLYPHGESNFVVYEDDGITSDYTRNKYAVTRVSMIGPHNNKLRISYIFIARTQGGYKDMVVERSTLLQVKANKEPTDLNLAINGNHIDIIKAKDGAEFQKHDNAYFYTEDFVINPYLIRFNYDDADMKQKFILIKIQKLDVTANDIQLKINGYVGETEDFGDQITSDSLNIPSNFCNIAVASNSTSLKWNSVENAQYYEIEKDGVVYTNIIGDTFTFSELKYESTYTFRIRAAVNNEVSEWSESIKINTLQGPYEKVEDEIASANIENNTLQGPSENIVEGVIINQKVSLEICHDVICVEGGKIGDVWNLREEPLKESILRLTFDLGQVESISKVCYVPRKGEHLSGIEFTYRFSVDGENWFDVLNGVTSNDNEPVETITDIERTFRYMEIKLGDTAHDFDGGEAIVFYKHTE